MKVIWKFPMTSDNPENIFQMPAGAKIVFVDHQGGVLTMWVECDSSAPREKREFDVYGTGQEIVPDMATHLYSWQEGPFVWHLYEVTEGCK